MSHVAGTMKTPVMSCHSARHVVPASPPRPVVGLRVGFVVVLLQQTPRRKRGDGDQTEVTRAQRVAELPVIAVAVGLSMAGRAFPVQTPPTSINPAEQVYSHFVAQQVLVRLLVTFEVRPVSSPVQRSVLVGTVHSQVNAVHTPALS